MKSKGVNILDSQVGRIAYRSSDGVKDAALFVHSNSTSSEVFAHQLCADIGRQHRMIAVDLPGHGLSDNSASPKETYCLPGYASVICEVLDNLKIDKVVLIGHSMGGNVAIEAFGQIPGEIIGIMTIGTAYIGKDTDSMEAAFLPHPDFELFFRSELDETEVTKVARAIIGEPETIPEAIFNNVRRTDPLARKHMLESIIAGNFLDEVSLVSKFDTPIAVVLGSEEKFVNTAYMSGLPYKNLWAGKVIKINSTAHAPQCQSPGTFNQHLGEFLHYAFQSV